MVVGESVPVTTTVVAGVIAKGSTVEVAFDSEDTKMDLSQARQECEAKKRKFNSLLRRYAPAPIGLAALGRNHIRWIDEISTALGVLVDSIETMSISHGVTLGTQAVTSLKDQITRSESDFADYVNQVENKLDEQPSPVPPVVAAPASGSMNTGNRTKSAEADVTVDAEIIATEAKKLSKEVNKFLDWGDATNEEIEAAMNNTEEWKKRFNRIQEKIFSIKRNILKFDLSDMKLKIATALVNTLESEMFMAIDNIKFEDDERCLYSNSKSKASDVKLPTFDGNQFDDFMKFKKETLNGFKSNKIKKDDQIKKLRECLSGTPKTLIPKGMESVEDAWLILKNMYGDSARVMTARKRTIEDFGDYPDGGEYGRGISLLNAQIEWTVKLEVAVADIVALGEESDQLGRDAYSSDMLLLILAFFPHDVLDKLEETLEPAGEDVKLKLTLLLQFLKKLRRRRQGLLKTAEHSEAIGAPVDDDSSSSDGSESDSDDLSDDERSEFAGVAVESYTSDTDDEGCSDDVSDEQHPHEPGGE